MKINIFPVVSSLHEQNFINEETLELLNNLKKELKCSINIVSVDELYNADLSLILIQSGGSEALFLENFSKLKEPYYLLTYGTNNSLAASLEILSYLKDKNLKAEVLHGSVEYLSSRINILTNKLKYSRYGIIGKPSDWLIASNVNYEDALKYYNIDLIDIDIFELIDEYNNLDSNKLYVDGNFNLNELKNANRLLEAISNIKKKYNLDGFTIRCFDLLESIKTTACLALGYFNSLGSVSTCEGDIPALISMHICNMLFNSPGFQANPSRIDVINNEMVLAHCTLPINMCEDYTLDTHFESRIGVAIKGKLKEDKITIFKLSRDLKHYYISSGRILENLDDANVCRTQIKIKVDNDISYFLNRPYGNHHIIIYGDHKDEIINFMNNIDK